MLYPTHYYQEIGDVHQGKKNCFFNVVTMCSFSHILELLV